MRNIMIMTHNNLNNNSNSVSSNDGIVIQNNNNNDSGSLESYAQQQQQQQGKTSDANTSIEEKCNVNDGHAEAKLSKKRKHRRGKKKRHNPYSLSNSEYEKIECEKIQRNRDKMAKQGKTLAPFNTTQFIMDEHRNEVPPTFDSVNSSDMDSDTTGEDVNYLSNEFNEEYEIAKLDYYRNLNKEQLLKECFDILSELNKLQDTVSKLTNENTKLKEQVVASGVSNDTQMN